MRGLARGARCVVATSVVVGGLLSAHATAAQDVARKQRDSGAATETATGAGSESGSETETATETATGAESESRAGAGAESGAGTGAGSESNAGAGTASVLAEGPVPGVPSRGVRFASRVSLAVFASPVGSASPRFVCTTPCEVPLPDARYDLSARYGDRSPVAVPGPLRLGPGDQLNLRYESRSGSRLAGWIALAVGGAGGLGTMALGGLLLGPGCDSGTLRDAYDDRCETMGTVYVITGAAVALAGLVTSIVLLRNEDSVTAFANVR